MQKLLLFLLFFDLLLPFGMQSQTKIYPGANEKTPSKAEYFSWINNTNEGATEKQTIINLNFFEWLKKEYGMQLDIYAFDAGAIDGKRFYGNIHSARFKKQFPNGFNPIYRRASQLGIRLGIWGGPDGFGNTPEQEKARTVQMVNLCKNYHFELFKFDAVCGPLRPEKEDAFIKMMQQCRKYSPDLILLNHRLGLNKAKPYATTYLWDGAETYIDVFMTNYMTAPHHRAAAISRGLVPGLKRLVEDHGVCLSSCLDNWDDDLVLQAFNRNLILSPEIYGNPWLLRDDEFPKLAQIFNIHRRYDTIMVNGKVLHKAGPYTVSRGNGNTRLITLRNLTWYPVTYTVELDTSVGLTEKHNVLLLRFHPHSKLMGEFHYGSKTEITVAPFRAALFLATTRPYHYPLVKGTAFDIIQNMKGKPIQINLIGAPGTKAKISIAHPENYAMIKINGIPAPALAKGLQYTINFPGKKLIAPANRKLAECKETPIPDDAKTLYAATVFAADNNALEVRSLYRSGKSNIPAVQRARKAFFDQPTFINRAVWDKNLFDGNPRTGFGPSHKYDIDLRIKGGAFRLDLGKVVDVDSLLIHVPNYFLLEPLLYQEGNYVQVSTDLKHWRQITYLADTVMNIPVKGKVRYLRFKYQPQYISEIEGYFKGKPLDRSLWRASNLFAGQDRMHCIKAWKDSFTLNQIPSGSYLSVALNGTHGVEGAYVAAKIDGKYVGAPDRAPSYPSNTWEYVVARRNANYTYYIPLKKQDTGKKIEVYVLGYDKNHTNIKPIVWLSNHTDGEVKVKMELTPKSNE